MTTPVNIHVVPRENGWAVYKAGHEKAAQIYETKELAVERGKVEAKAEKSELLIHGEDGQIKQKNSYGNDPKSVKG